MKKFENILFCTDLDGTLIANRTSISKENLDAIDYFKSEGGLFTFITGRMADASRDVYETLDPNIPFGCINGGGLYDHRKKEYLCMTPLPEEAREIIAYVDRVMPDVGIQLNTTKHIYFNKYNPAMVRFREMAKLPDVSCHFSEVKEPISKVIFTHDIDERVLELKKLLLAHPFADKVDFVRSEFTLFEMLPKGISKSAALHNLVRILGLDINKTIAIGDYDNDISMIRDAKLGIAVANASEGAKAVADHVTVSVHEHAIARVINDLDSGKLKL